MESNFNLSIIEGGVVKTPELRYTNDGLAVCKFSIANASYSYKNGEKNKFVSYFSITSFGKLAEICSGYLVRGSKVMVTGKLKQNRWENKEGIHKTSIELIAQDVKMLPKYKKNTAVH